MAADWDKSSIQELDVTANVLSSECLIDLLTRIPSIRWLSAGQIDAFNDTVKFIYTKRDHCRHKL